MIVKPKVSRWLTLIFVSLFAGAAILTFLIALPVAVKLAIVVVMGFSVCAAVARHALRRGPLRVVEMLRCETSGVWSVKFSNQADWYTLTLTSRFVNEKLVLLSGRVDGKRAPLGIVLAADAVEPVAFRRLRAALLAPLRSPAA